MTAIGLNIEPPFSERKVPKFPHSYQMNMWGNIKSVQNKMAKGVQNYLTVTTCSSLLFFW